ncbi:hypothetical protein H0H93_004111, partial [Arthromyces matolae]
SSLLLLALVLRATPVPTLTNPRLLAGDIQEDPSKGQHNDISIGSRPNSNLLPSQFPAIGDHDGVRPIRSYNPFDLSGIFARVDRKPKEEPQEHHGLSANFPPSTALSNSQAMGTIQHKVE